MAVDLSKFPEMKTFSSVIRYSLCLEEALEEFYKSAAQCLPAAAGEFQKLADIHRARYELLEDTRQQKLNEMILEPVCGLERDEYLPDVDIENEADLVRKAVKAEENAGKFYTHLSDAARELSREASKVYLRMAKENEKLKARVQAVK